MWLWWWLLFGVARGQDAARERAKEQVTEWNSMRNMPPSPTATVVVGHLRTGAFEAVAANIKDAVFAPLGRTDVFWIVSDAPGLVDITTTLTRWGHVASAVVEFADRDAYDTIEKNCTETRDGRVPLRACLPARAQFLSLARAWSLVVDAEERRARRYDWVLRLRPDMVHKKPLPPLDSWSDAPLAVYLDGWRWFGNCSASSHCTCFCAGDRYGVVARRLAPAVFGVAARVLEAGGCSPHWRCPRHFLERREDCYGANTHLYPECAFGSALIDAGLDVHRDVRKLHGGDLLSCGPLPRRVLGGGGGGGFPEKETMQYRNADDEPCLAAYWRLPSDRKALGPSIVDRPVPPVKSKVIPFWHQQQGSSTLEK